MHNVATVLMETVTAPGLPSAIETSLTKAFNEVATNVTDVIKIALPIGLGVMAITLSIKLGVRFFKSVTKG